MKHKKKKIIHFIFFYMLYLNIELHDRAYHGVLVGVNGISKWSLAGWTSLWMGLIGGTCGVIIGSLNDRPRYYNLKIWQQVIIGGSLITAVELLSGLFFNVYLHLNLWDYSYDEFNFLGQICLKNCSYWYLLSVVVIWLDDVLTYYYYGDKKPGSLLSYFKRLLTLK